MESYSFLDQIGLMRQCDCAMGISGAGHTNIHFMKKGSKFLDITARKNLEEKIYKIHFWKLANIIEVKYFLQLAEVSNQDPDKPFYNRNITIDLLELENNLKLMTNE
jgi:capsular polysaccharide biosynthesis protein